MFGSCVIREKRVLEDVQNTLLNVVLYTEKMTLLRKQNVLFNIA